MEKQKRTFFVLGLFALLTCLVVPAQLHADAHETGQWINHLDFLPGSDVDANFNTVAVRGGGLEITPVAAAPLNSFVQQGLQVPAGYLVSAVRVCYAQTGDSHIDRVTLLQLQDPPTEVMAVLDDDITFNGGDPGPVCMNTAPQRPFDPNLGALSLRLGVDFIDDADSVVVLGVGLLTVPDPDSAVSQLQDDVEQLQEDVAQLDSNQQRIVNVLNEQGTDIDDLERDLDRLTNAVKTHTHSYLTGRGKGHNNTRATTSTFILDSQSPTPKTEPEEIVKESPVVKEKPAKKKKFGFFLRR